MKIVQRSLPALGPALSTRELEEQIEKRYNENHDEKGQFAEGEGGSGEGGEGKDKEKKSSLAIDVKNSSPEQIKEAIADLEDKAEKNLARAKEYEAIAAHPKISEQGKVNNLKTAGILRRTAASQMTSAKLIAEEAKTRKDSEGMKKQIASLEGKISDVKGKTSPLSSELAAKQKEIASMKKQIASINKATDKVLKGLEKDED